LRGPGCGGAPIASNKSVRIRSLVAALAFPFAAALATPAVARAQEMDGGVDFAGGGFATPYTLQALLLYQLYGMQQQQISALPEAERAALAKRAADYFTNGAEATGVPTSGPGAAYFQNGAEVTAASTANAIAFGESAFPPAVEVSADASAAAPAPSQGVAAADAATPSASAPTAAVVPPVARSNGDAGGLAGAAPSPSESTGSTIGPPPSESLGTAESAASTTALAGLGKERASADDGNAANGSMNWLAPVFARLNFGWVGPVLAGLGLGAFAVFLGFRLRRPL
jgi:hypothetical protein